METLGFYNSVVGEPKLLILAGQLRVSVGLKGFLNNGDADFVPDVNEIEQRYIRKFSGCVTSIRETCTFSQGKQNTKLKVSILPKPDKITGLFLSFAV